jgi:CIC family chloride channel protein
MDGEESRQLPLAQLSLLALGLGVVTGVGAVLFRDLIGLIHNLLFTGHALVHYDANVFTAPAPWGALVILVPVLGAVGVTFLVTNFAPEAKGHGVPEVMDAIYYKGGVIRPVVALVKSLASAIAIGSGASVGRKGRSSRSARRSALRLDRLSACRRASGSHSSRRAQARASPPPSIRQSAA